MSARSAKKTLGQTEGQQGGIAGVRVVEGSVALNSACVRVMRGGQLVHQVRGQRG